MPLFVRPSVRLIIRPSNYFYYLFIVLVHILYDVMVWYEYFACHYNFPNRLVPMELYPFFQLHLYYNMYVISTTNLLSWNGVSERLLFDANSAFFSYINKWREQVNFQWNDDEVRFVLKWNFFIFSTMSLYDMNMRILEQIFKQTKYVWVFQLCRRYIIMIGKFKQWLSIILPISITHTQVYYFWCDDETG